MFHTYNLHIPAVFTGDPFPGRISRVVTFAKYLLPGRNWRGGHVFLKGNKCQKANLKYPVVSIPPGSTQPIFSIIGSPF